MIPISTAQEIIDRLKAATQAASDSELARLIGVSQQAVSSARKGKVPDSWARVALSRYGVSADWLYTGSGAMLYGERLPCSTRDLRRDTGEDGAGKLKKAERLAEERAVMIRALEEELEEARKAERRALLEANNALKRLLTPFAAEPDGSD